MEYAWVFVIVVKVYAGIGLTQVGPFDTLDACQKVREELVKEVRNTSTIYKARSEALFCFKVVR